MLGWVLEHIPESLVVLGGAALIIAAWRYLGFRGAIGAAVVVVSALLYRGGRKEGRAAQQNKEQDHAETAIKRADQARVIADRVDADPERLRDDDGFRRD